MFQALEILFVVVNYFFKVFSHFSLGFFFLLLWKSFFKLSKLLFDVGMSFKDKE